MGFNNSSHNKIYGDASIQISEFIGRTFNNPLGEYPFEKFENFFNDKPNKSVLDIGSGRGRAAILLAQRFGADVVGIEASEDMARFARHLVAQLYLENKIKIIHSDFLTIHLGKECFDVAIFFDVLSYFQIKKIFFEKTHGVLRRSGTILFSDYFCLNQKDIKIQALSKAWGISIPGDLNTYPNILSAQGFQIIHFENTTDRYLSHWCEIKKRCLENRNELIKLTSASAVEAYLSSVEAIIAAVNTGDFGHLFCVATRI